MNQGVTLCDGSLSSFIEVGLKAVLRKLLHHDMDTVVTMLTNMVGETQKKELKSFTVNIKPMGIHLTFFICTLLWRIEHLQHCFGSSIIILLPCHLIKTFLIGSISYDKLKSTGKLYSPVLHGHTHCQGV